MEFLVEFQAEENVNVELFTLMVVLTNSTLCNGEGVKNLYVNEFYKTLKPFFNTVSFNTLIPICHILENFFTIPQVDDYRNYLIKNDYISILNKAPMFHGLVEHHHHRLIISHFIISLRANLNAVVI